MENHLMLLLTAVLGYCYLFHHISDLQSSFYLHSAIKEICSERMLAYLVSRGDKFVFLPEGQLNKHNFCTFDYLVAGYVKLNNTHFLYKEDPSDYTKHQQINMQLYNTHIHDTQRPHWPMCNLIRSKSIQLHWLWKKKENGH